MTAPDYAVPADVMLAMPDVPWDATPTYALVLGVLITRVSRLIDRAALRQPGEFATGTNGTVRYFDGNGSDCLWVDEMAAAPSKVEVAEAGDLTVLTTWSSTDYILWPYNEPPYRSLHLDQMYGSKSFWPPYRKAVKVTAPWGFSVEVPEDLKQGVIVQTVRWFKRGQQGFSDVGAVAEIGQLRYVQKLDPDVEMILDGPGLIKRVI